MARVRMVWAGLLLAALQGACSLSNREGPDVSCADLQNGRYNACREGIIAYCKDGVTVKYKVCTEDFEEGNETVDADEICEVYWQVEGEFRCMRSEPLCFGCNPDAGP
jgi:hypothetical protein